MVVIAELMDYLPRCVVDYTSPPVFAGGTLTYNYVILYSNTMARARYWKMTPEEVADLTYDEQFLLNWDIKCVRQPEEDAIFIGVFMYRRGTPLDYKPIQGVVFYHNHISNDEVSRIIQHLKSRYGGKETKKGDRVFLTGSKEFYDPAGISSLALSMEESFNTKSVITLEFEGMSQEAMRNAGLPDSKLLPIPGK